MTDMELRIKVAELTGEWSRIAMSEDVWPEGIEEGWEAGGRPFGHHDGHGHPKHMVLLPDYPNDLNAIHEATLKIPKEKWADWRATLFKILGYVPGRSEDEIIDDVMTAELDFKFGNATARQRAEAFVATMKKEPV